MFRLAWTAALLVVALYFAPGRANDRGPPLGGRGADLGLLAGGSLLDQLRQEHSASFGAYRIFVRQVNGRQALDVVLKHRDARGRVDYWVQAKEMELRHDVGRKQVIIRLKQGTAHGADGSHAEFADLTREMKLP
jgi:hypothetical protein